MLRDFYLNPPLRDEVRGYLVEFLKTEAIRKVFEKEDVAGVAQAYEILEKAFENLETLFKPQHEKKDIINEAR